MIPPAGSTAESTPCCASLAILSLLIPGYASLDILFQHILGFPNLRNLYRDIRGYPDLPRAHPIVFPNESVHRIGERRSNFLKRLSHGHAAGPASVLTTRNVVPRRQGQLSINSGPGPGPWTGALAGCHCTGRAGNAASDCQFESYFKLLTGRPGARLLGTGSRADSGIFAGSRCAR